jgi:type IV pilus assembly protein PilO
MATGLENKPWYVAAIAGVVFGGIVAGLLYWQVSTKQQDQIRAQDSKIQELERKITEGRAAEQKLPQFREEVRRLELELDKLLRILPARRNTPELLRRIRALAEQGDFDLARFTPGNFTDRDFYSEWPIGIQLSGSYHNLALFFDRIGRFSRIINIENLTIGALRPQTPSRTIGASFTAKTFIYKEEVPPPPPPGPAARRPAPPAGGGGGGE